jgi:hypothetical protein
MRASVDLVFLDIAYADMGFKGRWGQPPPQQAETPPKFIWKDEGAWLAGFALNA